MTYTARIMPDKHIEIDGEILRYEIDDLYVDSTGK